MCGRYVVPNTTDELLSLFDATGANAADWRPSYSVAPTDPAPIVREWTRDETVQRDVDLAFRAGYWTWTRNKAPPCFEAGRGGVFLFGRTRYIRASS